MKSSICLCVAFVFCLFSSSFVSASLEKPENMNEALLVRMLSISLSEYHVFWPEKEMILDDCIYEYFFITTLSQKRYIIEGISDKNDRDKDTTIVAYEFVRFLFPGDHFTKMSEGEIYNIHLKMVVREIYRERIFLGEDGLYKATRTNK